MRTKLSDTRIQEDLEYCIARLNIFGIHISIEEIQGSSRVSELNGIRALIVVILREERHYSFARIGALLNRDHSTAIHLFYNYQKFNNGRLEDYARIRKALVKTKDEATIKLQIEVHKKAIDKLKKML